MTHLRWLMGPLLLAFCASGCGDPQPENKRDSSLFGAGSSIDGTKQKGTGSAEFEQAPKGPEGGAIGISEIFGDAGDYDLMVRLNNNFQWYNITAGDTNFCAEEGRTVLVIQFASRINPDNTLSWPNRYIKIETYGNELKVSFEADTSYGDDTCQISQCQPNDVEFSLRCPNEMAVAIAPNP